MPAGREPSRIVHAFISGRVQGVGFRAFVESEAQERALSGFVRNRRDGTVEALFAGPSEAVEAMLEACRRGPAHSRVAEVVVTEREDGTDLSGFAILRDA
jgi:acylphosphatase